MELHLVFPPKAYPRMPYASIYFLKGYIERNTSWPVHCQDLNVRYHDLIWSGRMPRPKHLNAQLEGRCQIITKEGPRALNVLRTSAHYARNARGLIRAANTILLEAEKLEVELAHLCGWYGRWLPKGYNHWQALLDQLSPTPSGVYVAWEASRLAEQLKPGDVVGFSCAYIEQLAHALLMARYLKRDHHFEGTILIGGGGFTHVLHDVLKDSSFWEDIDYGIPFEGEHTLLRVLEDLSENRRDFQERDVAYWHADAGVYRNRIHERPEVHAVPDFSEVEPLYPTPEIIYPLLTSKGCYWGKCAFCTHHEGYGQGWSMAPDDVVRDAVAHVAELGGRAFYFVDEALPARKVRYMATLFSDMRQKGQLHDPIWMAECRVEKVTARPEFLQLIKDAGCRLIINGMETGSQVVMDKMQKGVQLDVAQDFAQICQNIGIQLAWMFFIGFPGETESQARETFDLIEKCRHTLDYATVGVFGLERGSPIWNAPHAFGITEIIASHEPYRLVFDYVDSAGNVHSHAQLKRVWGRLMREYPQHLEKFQAIIDRTCSLFLSPPNLTSNVLDSVSNPTSNVLDSV